MFKQLLRTFFPEFLTLVAPELAAEVSLADVRFLEQELYADWPSGTTGEVDLLARVGEGQGCTFLIHVEVESSFNTDAARRLARYFYLLKSRHDEPVIPILVTLRGGPVGVLPLTLEEWIGIYRQVFAYTFFGISGCEAQEYLDRPEPLAWGLAALMQPGPGGRAALKHACLSRIGQAPLEDIPAFVLVNCVETYLQLDPEETAELESLRSIEANEEGRAVEMTWADRMRAEGMQMGLDKGREEGREEGARQLLRRQLERRFGELPPAALRQLAAVGSLDRLNHLAEQVLTARSLAELGLA